MKKKRGVPAGTFLRTEPIFKDKVLEIIRMRQRGATFREIAEVVGGTHMSAFSAHRRWQTWGTAELARQEAGKKQTRAA